MKYAWNSRKEPHVPIGAGCPKEFRRLITSQIQLVSDLVVEPTLCVNLGTDNVDYYRRRAMDDVKLIDNKLTEYRCGLVRRPREHLARFIRRLTKRHDVLDGMSQGQRDRLGMLYEIARFQSMPFALSEYEEYFSLLGIMITALHQNRHVLPLVIEEPIVINERLAQGDRQAATAAMCSSSSLPRLRTLSTATSPLKYPWKLSSAWGLRSYAAGTPSSHDEFPPPQPLPLWGSRSNRRTGSAAASRISLPLLDFSGHRKSGDCAGHPGGRDRDDVSSDLRGSGGWWNRLLGRRRRRVF
jgi:hypothetical protein